MTARRVRTRALPIAAAAVMALLALTACSGSGGSNNAKGNTTITYALWDPNEAVGYKECVSAFEAANPSVSVDVQVIPYASYWTKIDTTSAAGDAPDVFWDSAEFQSGLVAKNAIRDLTPYIKSSGIKPSVFTIPAVAAGMTLDGKTYGLQKDWDAVGEFYNRAELKKAGYSSVPKNLTWNTTDGGSFLTLLQKLTVDSSGKNATQAGFKASSIVQYGFAYMDSTPQPADLDSWIYSNGGYVLKDNSLGFNLPATQQGVAYVNDLINKWHVAPPYSALASATPSALFTGGRVAVWQTGPWETSAIHNAAQFPVGVGMTPSGKDGSWTRVSGLMDNISTSSKHPAQAWKWVDFIASSKCQDILGKSGVVFPATKAGTDYFASYWKKKGIDVQPFIEASHNNGNKVVTDPVVTDGPQFASNFTQQIENIFNANVSVPSGLGTLQQKNSKLLAK
jgi:multiple sugar transport system substrate-binding protein